MISKSVRNQFRIGLIVAALLALLPVLPARAASMMQSTKDYQQPFASAARGTTTSSAFKVSEANAFIAYLTVTAKDGGATSLDLKYQDSPDGSTWFDLTGASFSQVVGSTSSQAVVATRSPSAWVRAVATVVGTTFTFHSEFMAQKLVGGQVITSTTDGSLLTGLSASALASGTVPDARFPATLPVGSGVNLTAINATNLGSGTVPDARFPATLPAGSGINLTALNATNLGSGTVPLARIAALTNTEISASAAIAASKLAEDAIRTAQVTVATGAVLTLNGTPVALVAAPGSGKITLIEEITAKLVFATAAYTGGNALEFRYTNGSGAKVSADLASTFINSASGTNYATVKSVVTAVTPVANAAVVVFVPAADPAAGDSPIVFTVKYRIVTP